MKPEDIGKIQKGDYLELQERVTGNLCFLRVLSITDPDLIYLDRSVVLMQVHPTYDTENKITWDYEYLKTYVQRLINDPAEKRMIKLLYDC